MTTASHFLQIRHKNSEIVHFSWPFKGSRLNQSYCTVFQTKVLTESVEPLFDPLAKFFLVSGHSEIGTGVIHHLSCMVVKESSDPPLIGHQNSVQCVQAG